MAGGRSRQRSEALFLEARQYIPGGVNSPVRAFRAVGGVPLFIASGKGSRLYDVDGNEYLDYVLSWGPLILGHCAPAVVAALHEAATKGTSFGAPTAGEVHLARLIGAAFPFAEMVRLVSSGTEAAMSAIRLARGYTGRADIVKFAGCYHGHADALLVEAGSGGATFGVPTSAGIPEEVARRTVVLPFNDAAAFRRTMEAQGDEIAGVIVEPVAGNMGVVPPVPGFLRAVRDHTREHGALLIFDEVITGFRIAYGGAAEYYGVEPDMVCLGKVLGGGLPIGAFGGKREIMMRVSPEGPVYQAGTLSGNPLAVQAGIATLTELQEPGTYEGLDTKARALADGLTAEARRAGIPVTLNRVASMLSLFFTPHPVTDYASARMSDAARFARFHAALLEQGVYLAPSPFEALFVSTAHTEDDIEATIAASARAFAAL